ncbi:MAG: alcohol dehydrogenase catalytic domain-containing protein [Deltaproteobacteria bacterium]|nr:alcohol dehydrogenase catalytic domain-containing protein [Deltaproteobacteria bacterium]
MRALHWDGQSLQVRSTYPEPQLTPGKAVVKVALAGICSTDLQILRGYMGFAGVPGHEFVGTVVDGPDTLRGQRVVGEINFACGACAMCARDLQRHCPTRRVMGILNADGSFAEYLAVPLENLHVVPENVTDEEAVFTEPLAAAFEVLEQLPLQPETEVVVFGDGKLGLLCAQVLHSVGARVTLVGKHPDKLALMRGLGIATEMVSRWTAKSVDVVVEATGSTIGLSLAMAAVRPRGTLILKSTVAQEHALSLAPLVINEVTVIGSRCGRFPPALHALAHKQVAVTPLITAIYSLSDGIAAVNRAMEPEVLKVLLRRV